MTALGEDAADCRDCRVTLRDREAAAAARAPCPWRPRPGPATLAGLPVAVIWLLTQKASLAPGQQRHRRRATSSRPATSLRYSGLPLASRHRDRHGHARPAPPCRCCAARRPRRCRSCPAMHARDADRRRRGSRALIVSPFWLTAASCASLARCALELLRRLAGRQRQRGDAAAARQRPRASPERTPDVVARALGARRAEDLLGRAVLDEVAEVHERDAGRRRGGPAAGCG